MNRAILIGLIIIIPASSLLAQQTQFISDPLATFKQAKEFYQKEYYSLAYPLFKEMEQQYREADQNNQPLVAQEIKSVSYTHLTLPTIYSV